MNSEFILDQAARFAARLKSEAGKTVPSKWPEPATGFYPPSNREGITEALDFLSRQEVQLKKIQEKADIEKKEKSPRKMKSQRSQPTCA